MEIEGEGALAEIVAEGRSFACEREAIKVLHARVTGAEVKTAGERAKLPRAAGVEIGCSFGQYDSADERKGKLPMVRQDRPCGSLAVAINI